MSAAFAILLSPQRRLWVPYGFRQLIRGIRPARDRLASATSNDSLVGLSDLLMGPNAATRQPADVHSGIDWVWDTLPCIHCQKYCACYCEFKWKEALKMYLKEQESSLYK